MLKSIYGKKNALLFKKKKKKNHFKILKSFNLFTSINALIDYNFSI